MTMKYVAYGAPAGGAIAWVRMHPIGAFLLWFFTVGWAITFIPLVTRRILGIDLPFQPFALATNVLGLLPMVVITRLVDGQAGLHALRRQVLKVRAAVGWYALTLVAIPLIALIGAGMLFGPPEATASMLLTAFMGGLLLQTVIGCITNNLWEDRVDGVRAGTAAGSTRRC